VSPSPRSSVHPGSGLIGFATGLTYPLRGIAFLARNRSAWAYAIVPGLVNFLVLLLVFGTAMFLVDDLAGWLRPDFLEAGPAAAAEAGRAAELLGKVSGAAATAGRGIGTALVYALSFVLAAAGAMVVALLVAAGLAGPFQERLSEVIEQIATGETIQTERMTARSLARDGARAVSTVLQRGGLFGILYIPLFALSIVPVVGVVGVVGTLVYTAFFGALNFMDPTLERRKLPLRHKLAWARGRLAPWLGYGTGLLAILMIPFLGLLLTPAFVTGGTLLWLDARAPELAPPPPSPA
jgi:CysZ protein